jgi:hypothetical protein
VRAAGLFGPWMDVLLLGGGSVIALLILRALDLDTEHIVSLALLMLILANFVNHPHFAFSYQIFYGCWDDVKHGRMPADLRRRWWFAGLIAPIGLALGLVAGAVLSVNGSGLLLGLMLALMGLLVGWHYVKQGFGMAMVDAALKKCYWPSDTRKALLYNAYACWGAAWAKSAGPGLSSNLWGVSRFGYKVPGELVIGACAVAGLTTIWCALAVFKSVSQWRKRQLSWKEMPVAGLVAYVITLYMWMGLMVDNLGFALVVPFFHSLQYITVVSRYKINETHAHKRGGKSLFLFVLNGTVLGALGFWLLPGMGDYLRTGAVPRLQGGAALFIACTWIFINVHHYFIDNVIWRQGNPKTKRFLFDTHAG